MLVAPQITGVSIVCPTVCSGADQRKHQSPASLFFRGEYTSYRWILPTKGLQNVSIWWRHHSRGVTQHWLTKLIFARHFLSGSDKISVWKCAFQCVTMSLCIEPPRPSDAYMGLLNETSLVQIMARRVFGPKSLHEPVQPCYQLKPWEQFTVNIE